jgi:uncharacterized protein involved in response to NO
MRDFALWNLGFRPFYLVASLYSALGVLLWTAQFTGYLPFAFLSHALWHGHEMLFGFTLAVVAGFLLTAVRAWTGLPTAAGAALMALVGLWLAGRVLVLTPFGFTSALVNAAFPAAVAVAIGLPLVQAGNRRNYFFIGLLLLFAALGLALHLALVDRLAFSPRIALQLALDVMLFIMVVMGGRVIPMFTNGGVPGAGASRHPLVEKLALGSVLLLFAAQLMQWPPAIAAAIALFAAAVHAVRLLLWRPWRTLGTPLVWILHAGYAWIVVHLALRALAGADWVAGSYATHALAAGAIGGLTIGMMTRTARGHTGRPLVADRFETTAFLMILLSALVRVFGPMALPALYVASIQLSGVLWAAAFGLYAVRYWPVLTRPRLDGRPG